MGCPRRNELQGELLMTIRIGHRLFHGLQIVSGKHGGSTDEGLSIVGLEDTLFYIRNERRRGEIFQSLSRM